MSENLKKGVAILYDMELNNYFMTKSIAEINQKITQLRQKLPFYAPEKNKSKISKAKYAKKSVPFGIILSLIVGLLITISHAESGETMLMWVMVSLMSAFICVPTCIFIGLGIGSNYINKNQAILDLDYEKECKEKRKQLALIQDENIRQSNILFLEKESLIKRKTEATQKLNEFYEAMGIDEKFRNIVPIGYMNDFLRLGIANKLDGADGLYYLIMKELRWDQLQHSLEDISYKLDTVIDNQKALYHELVAINYKCDELVRLAEQEAKMAAKRQQTLEQIAHNTAVNAYNTRRVKQEIEFSNFMQMLHI